LTEHETPPPPPDALPAPEEPSLEGALCSALRRAAHTGHALSRHVERLWPGFLKEREGLLYPVLLELWRRGEVEASWDDLPQGRRRVYRAPGTPRRSDFEHPAGLPEGARFDGPETVEAAARPATGGWNPALEKAARAATASLSFAPRLEAELCAELVGHLEDAEAAYRALGRGPAQAEERAIADLGDPWRIRTDLKRAAQGKRTVIFPGSWLEQLHGIAIYDLRVLLVIMAAILFVRVQVVTAYHIPTRSMEPTLHGDPDDGDRILVNKWSLGVDRFDIVVFDGWGSERKNFVKRAVGLPGDKIELFGGNLWVDGELHRKQGAALDAMLFPLFRIEDEIEYARRDAPDTWKHELQQQLLARFKGSRLWRVAIRNKTGVFEFEDTEQTGGETELRFDDNIKDGVYDVLEAASEGGREYVADLRVEVDVTPASPGAWFALQLSRGPTHYEAQLSHRTGGGWEIRVDGEPVAQDSSKFSFEPGVTHRVRFSQVDFVLRLEIDGELVATHELPAPEFPSRDTPRGAIAFDAGSLAGQAVKVAMIPIELERDIHWTSGDYDDQTSIQLADDEYFMLGDNSSNSQDSRSRGPVHANRLVGSPMLVVWPPARLFVVPR